jgi:hypothetical protein
VREALERRAKEVISEGYLDRRSQEQGAGLLFFDWAPRQGVADPPNIQAFYYPEPPITTRAVKGKGEPHHEV